MTFETIKVFSNPMEAHILKAALEGQGIQCYLFDENIVSLNPLYTNVVGGIKLKVAAEDKELALQILTEIDETPYTDNDDHVIKCPKCFSTNIESGKIETKGIWPKIVGFISLILFIYPVSVNRVYRCKECDTEFK